MCCIHYSLEAATPSASGGHLLGEYHLPKEALTWLAEIFLGLAARLLKPPGDWGDGVKTAVFFIFFSSSNKQGRAFKYWKCIYNYIYIIIYIVIYI